MSMSSVMIAQNKGEENEDMRKREKKKTKKEKEL